MQRLLSPKVYRTGSYHPKRGELLASRWTAARDSHQVLALGQETKQECSSQFGLWREAPRTYRARPLPLEKLTAGKGTESLRRLEHQDRYS